MEEREKEKEVYRSLYVDVVKRIIQISATKPVSTRTFSDIILKAGEALEIKKLNVNKIRTNLIDVLGTSMELIVKAEKKPGKRIYESRFYRISFSSANKAIQKVLGEVEEEENNTAHNNYEEFLKDKAIELSGKKEGEEFDEAFKMVCEEFGKEELDPLLLRTFIKLLGENSGKISSSNLKKYFGGLSEFNRFCARLRKFNIKIKTIELNKTKFGRKPVLVDDWFDVTNQLERLLSTTQNKKAVEVKSPKVVVEADPRIMFYTIGYIKIFGNKVSLHSILKLLRDNTFLSVNLTLQELKTLLKNYKYFSINGDLVSLDVRSNAAEINKFLETIAPDKTSDWFVLVSNTGLKSSDIPFKAHLEVSVNSTSVWRFRASRSFHDFILLVNLMNKLRLGQDKLIGDEKIMQDLEIYLKENEDRNRFSLDSSDSKWKANRTIWEIEDREL